MQKAQSFPVCGQKIAKFSFAPVLWARIWFVLFFLVNFGLFLFLRIRQSYFPPKMGILAYFSVSPFFLLSLSCFVLSLSLSLSLSPLLLLLLLLLLRLLLLLPCFQASLFLGISFLPCFFAFVAWNEQLQNAKLERFLSSILSDSWFPKGHLNWPLNPQYFSWFIFCCVFCVWCDVVFSFCF